MAIFTQTRVIDVPGRPSPRARSRLACVQVSVRYEPRGGWSAVSGPPWLFPAVAPSGFFSPEYTGRAQSMHTEAHPWHSTLSTEAGRAVTHGALACLPPSSVTVSSPPLPGNPQSPGSWSHVVPSAGLSRRGSDPSFLLSFVLEGLFSVAVTEHLSPVQRLGVRGRGPPLTRLLLLQELCGAPRPGWTSQARGRLARELVPYNSRSLHSPLMS